MADWESIPAVKNKGHEIYVDINLNIDMDIDI